MTKYIHFDLRLNTKDDPEIVDYIHDLCDYCAKEGIALCPCAMYIDEKYKDLVITFRTNATDKQFDDMGFHAGLHLDETKRYVYEN